MAFEDEIAEAARRLVTQDNWYHLAKEPYILELRSVPVISGLPAGFAFIVFPLGPENYKVTRVFRQSVTPTLGGLVAEERGILWRMLTITGTFGLTPKFGIDTSLTGFNDPTIVLPVGGFLSGPGWTRRMMRNFFDRYGELKADPLTADQTQLIWHDTKTGDSWVVVPEQVDVDRTSARRGQYPYSLQLKAIAKANLVFPIPPLAVVRSVVLAGKLAVVAEVTKGQALISASRTEMFPILGEVRFFVSEIDAIFEDLETIQASAQAFIDGESETIDVGRATVQASIADVEAALLTMEAEPDLPNSTRQTLQMTADGLDIMASQISAYGVTYQDNAAAITAAEAGVDGEDDAVLTAASDNGPLKSAALQDRSRVRSSDQALKDAGALSTGRTFASYSGFEDYAIQSTDTLQSIASRFLGDGALWYDLAIVNGLQHPYISRAGIPGTVRVGDVISIPTLTAPGANAIVAGEGSEPGEEVLGVDIALKDTAFTQPGRPAVDIVLDRRTLRDVQTIRGFPNLAQAMQLRIWTEQGHMPLVPGYGLPRTIGVKQTVAFLALLRLNYEQTIRQDSRVQNVGAVTFEVVEDLIEVDVDIVPRGSAGSARTVSTALV